jgi:hypothetical protein
MPDDFSQLMAEGFAAMLDATNAPTITRKGHSARCVSTPIASSKELREEGYWPKFGAIVEVLRADLVPLKVVDRSVVTFASTDPAVSLLLKVIGIEDDPADPCVKLTLKEEPGLSAER